MDSASAPPEPGAFGRSLAHRMTPQVTVIRRAVVQPGFIARRSIAFGSYVGQSQVSRWSIGATMSRGAMAVRPPIDYWPWASAEEPEPVAVPRLDRSLPRAKLLRRSGQPDPGAIVKAMKPEPIDLATRGQSKAPKRNDMQSFKAMLERTGRLPAADGDAAADDRPRGGVASAPSGRDRAAAPARPAAPARAAAPAAAPRATTTAGAASPRAARTAPAPASVGTGPVAAGRPGPTPPRPQRPNPFDHDDEPGPTLRRSSATTAPAPPAEAAPRLDAAAAAGIDSDAQAGRSLDLPVSPVWPGAIESTAVTATPPTISARRADEQLRSARGPRPLPAVISPSVEQLAPRKWSTTDTIDAGELAQQLLARRTAVAAPPITSPSADSTPATSPAATMPSTTPTAAGGTTPTAAPTSSASPTSSDGRFTGGIAPATRHPSAPGAVPEHVDAATAAVAPAGVERVEIANDDHATDVVRRTATGVQPTPATTLSGTIGTPPRSADRPAATGSATDTSAASPALRAERSPAESAEATAVAHPAEPTTAAAAPTVAPPALLVQRSTPVGPSLLLPFGEATAPRPDTRERARQLPAHAAPAAAVTDAVAAAPPRDTALSERTQQLLARPLSPQPPDLTMPTAPAPPAADVAAAVRPAGFASPSSTTASATSTTSAAAPTPVVRRSPATEHATSDRPAAEHRSADLPAPAHTPIPTAPVTRERPAPPVRPTPDRFLQVLGAAPAPAPKRLPARFATLARSIAGDAPVQLRHDDGARAALAAVGKRAATIGNTILLDSAPTSAAATTVLAHELTHVANPTMAPRFYDDERQTVEERRADAVAQLIQRSPSLLAAPPAGTPLGSTAQPLPPATGALPPATVRRSVDPSLPPPPPQRASALATPSPAVRPMAPSSPPAARSSSGTTSTGSASRAATVRRSPASTSSRSSAGGSGNGNVIRRATAGSGGGAGGGGLGGGSEPSTIRRASFGAYRPADPDITGYPLQGDNSLPPLIEAMKTTGGQLDFVDWIVEQVEDRVVAEFQRRGGRFREDF